MTVNMGNKKKRNIKKERAISSAYAEINTDLARDNLENDLTSADIQDLQNLRLDR